MAMENPAFMESGSFSMTIYKRASHCHVWLPEGILDYNPLVTIDFLGPTHPSMTWELNTRVGQQGKRQGNFKVLKHPVALQDFCIIVTPGYDPQFSPHWEPFTEIKTLINVPVQSNPKLHGSTLHYHFLRSQNARIMSDSGAFSQHTPIVLIHHLEFRPGLLLFFHDLFMAHWKGSSQAGRTQAF